MRATSYETSATAVYTSRLFLRYLVLLRFRRSQPSGTWKAAVASASPDFEITDKNHFLFLFPSTTIKIGTELARGNIFLHL